MGRNKKLVAVLLLVGMVIVYFGFSNVANWRAQRGIAALMEDGNYSEAYDVLSEREVEYLSADYIFLLKSEIELGFYDEAEKKIDKLVIDNELETLQDLVDYHGVNLNKLLVKLDEVEGIVFENGIKVFLGEMHLYHGSLTRALELGAISTDEYLNENMVSLDIHDNGDYTTFSLLDEELDNNKVFLIGEGHGTADNIKLEVKLLQYFVQEAGVKYYLVEKSYNESQMINQYLETGDTRILDRLFAFYRGSFSFSEEEYNKWKTIYEFNRQLPKDQRIEVVGIDIVHGYGHAIEYMYSLMNKNEIPNEIEPVITEMIEFYDRYRSQLVNNNPGVARMLKPIASNINESIISNEDIYKEYLKEDFFSFKFVNENILALFEAQESQGEIYKIREAKIYENFLTIYPRLEEGKFFGQWGMMHVLQQPTSYSNQNVEWLGYMLDSDNSSPVKGGVLSAIYLYDNATVNTGTQTFNYSPMDHSRDIFGHKLQADHAMLRLNAVGSPFEEKLIWPFPFQDTPHRGKPEEDVTTDYFQYIIVIRNSEAPTPLN